MKRIAVALVLSLAISACATSGAAKVRGKTAADERLASDTFRMFSVVAGVELKCNAIEYAEVKSSSVSGANADETWVAHGCGKSAPFEVSFFPALQGGYNYSIKAIK